jgi:hypothetical protein
MKLGFDPPNLPVVLVTGADFNATLTYMVNGVATNWPASTAISLWFDNSAIASWSATVSTSTAVFAIDKATADTVPDGTEARVLYVNGSDDLTLTIGKVERR